MVDSGRPIKDVYMSTEVVAIVVSVFSLLVSLYATRLAKTAPDREQLRVLKDDLRAEVVQVRRIVNRLQKQVDAGKFIDEPDKKLESVSQLLSENLHRFRIQETGRLRLVVNSVGTLYSAWHAVYYSDRIVGHIQDGIDALRAREDVPEEFVKREERQRTEASRQADLERTDFREQLKDTLNQLDRYLDSADKYDRRVA